LKTQWQLVAQAVGTGLLRLDAPNDQAALAALSILRAKLQRMDGALVVLGAPVAVKDRFDVWGYGGDALPLMQRVRERFDPQGTLNPGRFLGF
jgi:glycolate oxidase FAD binding subunit